MLFLNKRNHTDQRRSGKDACLSIIGLFLAIAIITGLAGLIYGKSMINFISIAIVSCLGLVKSVMTMIIAFGIVLGVSVVCTVLFILLIVICH